MKIFRNHLPVLVLCTSITNSSFLYSNMPEVPGANVLVIVVDEKNNLVYQASINVDVIFGANGEKSNYSYKINMNSNPENIGLMVAPADADVKCQFIATKEGYSDSKARVIDHREYSKKIGAGYRVEEEVKKEKKIPSSIKGKALELSRNAATLLVLEMKSKRK